MSAGSWSPAELSALYQEIILDHYRSPRNKGALEGANAQASLKNPLCGDEVAVELRVDGGVIRDARFTGCGCSISQASASMMTRAVAGMPASEARALATTFGAMLRGDAAAAADPALGDLRAMSAVAKFPARVRCASLAWEALASALGERR